MKKFIIFSMTLILSSAAFASGGELERLDKKTVKAMTQEEMQSRALVLEQRVQEINAMDFDALERSERKALKKELRYINREATAIGNGGVYISVGALLVIIIILLII